MKRISRFYDNGRGCWLSLPLVNKSGQSDWSATGRTLTRARRNARFCEEHFRPRQGWRKPKPRSGASPRE